jgi:hypothetical protein
MQTLKTRYVGRITDSETAKNAAMQVAIEVIDDKLQIMVSEDEQWAYDMTDVRVSRVAIDRFKLELGEENLYFLPVDPRGFVTDVVEAHSDGLVGSYQGWLRRRIESAQSEGTLDADFNFTFDLTCASAA